MVKFRIVMNTIISVVGIISTLVTATVTIVEKVQALKEGLLTD